ncbi:MAG TPA: hypothetical protein EYP80_02915, partial [Candidatus Aenigmarchaeota archaeon]|nr:hypothetical protein [Candidatus Aenigmarchaeota archaeon]
SSLLTWTLKGNNRGTYIINVTAYSSDGKFNKSVSKQVIIKYGDLVVDLYSAPSSKEVNQSFDLSVKVENNGTWNASNVTVKIEVCDTIKTTDCSKVTISPGSYKICEATGFSCSSTGIESIYVWFDSVKDATYDEGKVGEIAITSSSPQDPDGDGNQETNYDIYFESIEVDGKETTTVNILQSGKKTLNITVRNIGDVTLNDCYLSISGINSSYYSITPTKKRDMGVGNELSFEIYFSIPDDFKPGNYTLLIKLVSNEYEEGTTIYLKILKVDVKINLTNIEVVQGSQKKIEFYLENIGEATLHNIKLNLTGISSEYYILSPTKVTSLAENKKTYISLEFNIPETESIDYKELTFNVISDEKNFSKKINLTVLPSEEEKTNINNSYYKLIKEFENLTKSIKEAKAQGKNVSSLENRLNEINESLDMLKEYIDQGKYIEAKELINSLSSDIQSLYQNLQVEVKSESSIILVVAIALIIVILSIILLYTFIISKREPTIKSVYKFKKKNRLHEILNSIRNLFVKT